jgi:methionyl aminopeptidase
MTPEELISKLLIGVSELAEPGINLLQLESYANDFLALVGAKSANRGYKPAWAKTPFPSILCLSVNDTISHGIPYDYTLKDGDLLTIDCGLSVDNSYADAALTVGIGTISSRDERLLRYAKKALEVGISCVKPGVEITAPGRAIEKFVKKNGFVINKHLNGHGIGKAMHEEPIIPMYDIGLEEIKTIVNGKAKYEYKEYENVPVFELGKKYCLEPHLSYNDQSGILQDDGWTIKTRDGQKSAMFESMVEVTENGCRVLTTHIT